MHTQRATIWLRLGLASLVALALPAAAARAVPIPSETPIYTNSFSGSVGSEWSDTRKATTPLKTQTYGDFLGHFSHDAQTDDEVTLTLAELDPGMYHVYFDLFIIRSWDGIEEFHNALADRWSFGLAGHDPMVFTSFSNNLNRQTFPDAFNPSQYDPANPNPAARYSGPSHPKTTMSSEKNSLGFTFPGVGIQDAVYKMDFTFELTEPTMVLRFAGLGLDSPSDASWGLDNVVVARVPEPSTLLLAVGALAALAALRRQRR